MVVGLWPGAWSGTRFAPTCLCCAGMRPIWHKACPYVPILREYAPYMR